MSATHNDTKEELSHVEPDDIGVGMLTVLGALVFVAILLIVVLLQAWFYNWKDAILAQRIGPVDEQTAPAMIAREQLQRIQTYGWADPRKHIRAIPIGRAMDLVVQEYSTTSDKSESATGAEKESEPK